MIVGVYTFFCTGVFHPLPDLPHSGEAEDHCIQKSLQESVRGGGGGGGGEIVK